MKTKIIKHEQSLVSMLSEDMAKHFQDKVTPAQYEVLKHNVYELEDGDVIYSKYSGCGCGWVEIDRDGNPIDLQYIKEEIADVREGDWVVASSRELQDLYLTTGQKEQNIYMLNFHTDQIAPKILENGNIRLLVNFSCYELVRF